MCSEYLHEPTVGQNDLTQSLFYTEVLSISHNVLNPVLKVKNRNVEEKKNGCRWVGLSLL